mgnify:CR=1 FL=1
MIYKAITSLSETSVPPSLVGLQFPRGQRPTGVGRDACDGRGVRARTQDRE